MSNTVDGNGNTEDDESTERKTLHQQLKENRGMYKIEHQKRKHQEYRQQMESQNSSYKLDDKSRQFYESLREKELKEEQDQKLEDIKQLEKFRRIRQTNEKPIENLKISSKVTKPIIKVPLKKLNHKQEEKIKQISSKESSPSPIVSGYSSSEDEDDD
ncbi:hypothetical protein DFJ63DRAFT_336134 [Scheffersomyces coipomensis]|uniref:uncharacterized protein n=1 Tax=Scheffersomyces coipomensis TaxID=1788519 RepID=UPI00315DE631